MSHWTECQYLTIFHFFVMVAIDSYQKLEVKKVHKVKYANFIMHYDVACNKHVCEPTTINN